MNHEGNRTSTKHLRLVIVEDSLSDATLMIREIQRGGYTVDYRRVETAAGLNAALDEASWDAVLADYSLPTFDAPAALAIVRDQRQLDLPLIVVSGTIGEDIAVKVMKAGASDYFHKNKLQRLVPALEREIRDAENRRRWQVAEERVRQAEHRFARAFHASPVGIVISRLADGTVLATNQRFLEITRYEEHAIIGKAGTDLSLWVEAEQRESLVARLRNNESVDGVEVELRRPSGEQFHTLLSAEQIELDGELCVLSFLQDITEQKRHQQEILETKSLLEATFASLNEAVLIIGSADRTILMCNAAVEDVFGYTPDELVGQQAEILHVDRERYLEFGRVGEPMLEATNIFQTEYQMRHRDGQILDTEHTITSLYPDQGFRAGVVSVVRDITDRKAAEQRVAQANERVRLLLDIAVAANAAPDAHTILQITINEVCAHTGWDVGHAYLSVEEDGAGLYSVPVWFERDPERFQAFRQQTETAFDANHAGLIHTVVETSAAQQIVDVGTSAEFVRADVARQCGLRSGYAFPIIADDQVAGVLEFFSIDLPDERARDLLDVATHIGAQVGRVIERQRARARLTESDERYRALFDRSLNAIYVHDFAGNFLDANPAARDLLGYNPEGIRRISFQTLLRAEDLERAEQAIQQTIAQGFQQHVTEFPLRRKDGEIVYAETLSSVMYHEGKPWAIQGIARDITARKAAEVSLQRYAERLELLRAIDRAILSTEPSQTIAQNTLRQLKHIIPYYSANVLTFDAELQNATFLAMETVGDVLWQIGDTISTEHHPALGDLQRNHPYGVDDTAQTEEFRSQYERRLVSQGIRSYIGIPLIAGGNLLGALSLHADQPDAFSAQMIEIGQEIGAQLAIALENARLLRTERQHNAELTALHQASLQLTSSLELRTVLDFILDYAMLLVDANNAHIFLYDGEDLRFGSAFWGGKKQTRPIAEPRREGMTYAVAQTGKRRIISNVNESPFYEEWPWGGAIVGLPLTVGGKVNGVMSLAFTTPRNFERQLIRLLELLAAQAAIAIDNAQLYEQIQQHADSLEQRVTERTAELQHQKERMEIILRSSSDGILLLAQDGSIRQANRAFCALFGCKDDAIVGQSFAVLAGIGQAKRLQQVLQDVVDQRAVQRVELTARKHNGEPFEADVVLSPIQDGDGDRHEIVCSLRDITARKQTEAELRSALEKERELSELKSSFTSMVSHEFRTPLAAILTSVDLLRQYHERLTTERREQKLDTIKSQVKRLNQLMDEVLIIGRADSVGLSFAPQAVNVIGLCNDIIDEIQAVEGDEVPVEFVHEGACTRLTLDPDLFRHIFQNLVSNAVKYSTTGGTVTITLTCADDKVVIAVADEGIGIPAEDQERLFTVFHRAKNVGTIQGTGFGLSIVQRAVERHGGTIEFTSAEGEGSTFTATLPVTPGDSVASM